MSHRSENHRHLLQVALILQFIACGLIGCNGAAPTHPPQSPTSPTDSNLRPAQSEAGLSEIKAVDSAAGVSASPPQVAASSASDPDWTPLLTKVDAAQLIGSWQDSFFGSRILTLNVDGTARMQLDFDLAGSLRYGQQLDLDMKWRLEGAVVKVDIISGKPADAAKLLMDDWGTHHIYLLDRVEPELIQMRDPEHTLRHSLRRLNLGTDGDTQMHSEPLNSQ